MGFLAKVVLNLRRSLFLFNRATEKNTDSCTKAAYNYRCCITGLSIPKLLVASHIVPWRIDSVNRLNPRNGLALSVLHDKAFDLGMITINEDMTVQVSKKEFRVSDEFVVTALKSYDGKSIELPDKFRPDEEFLDYHRQNVFTENG